MSSPTRRLGPVFRCSVVTNATGVPRAVLVRSVTYESAKISRKFVNRWSGVQIPSALQECPRRLQRFVGSSFRPWIRGRGCCEKGSVRRTSSGRPRESRDCAEIEPELHQLLTGAQAVTGIAAEAPPEVQPPNAAYHCRGHGASEGRGAQ